MSTTTVKHTIIKLTATQYERYRRFWELVTQGHANAKQRPAVIVINGKIHYRATPQVKPEAEKGETTDE